MVEFPILEFLKQKKTHEGFITGPGGSGKTEMLINICNILNEAKINYRVVAYTNKAVEVINKRVPTAPTSTLHSWLTKRPGINSKAKHLKSLMISNQYGVPAPLQLLIVDEFSMVSEEDYADIGMLVDPDMEGDIKLYTLYIGDLAQLPPIKSVDWSIGEGIRVGIVVGSVDAFCRFILLCILITCEGGQRRWLQK